MDLKGNRLRSFGLDSCDPGRGHADGGCEYVISLSVAKTARKFIFS
jgi:hypothetical protein